MPEAKKKASVRFGDIRMREYAREPSSGGIPEGEPGCRYALGISNVVLVRGGQGELLHGLNIADGTVVPPTALDGNGTDGSARASTAPSAASASVIAGINSGAAVIDPLLAPPQPPSAFAAGGADPRARLAALKPGERVVGSVDSYDDAKEHARQLRMLELLKGKGGKKGAAQAPAALLSKMQWHCGDAKERLKKMADNPCTLAGAALAAEAERIASEYTIICKGRAESNVGCRCGALSLGDLSACSKGDLSREAHLRGLPATGTKKALMERLAAHSKTHLGCTSTMHGLLDRLTELDAAREAKREAEGADGGSSPASPTSPGSIESMAGRREDEASARLQRLLESLPPGAAVPEDSRQRKAFVRAFLLSDDLARGSEQPVALAAGAAAVPAPGCPCEAEGIGCHYNTCSCDPDACDNRHLWDPTSAVYADRLFELHRAAVHFLNASWDHCHRGAAAAGGAAAGCLHLPGGLTFELPGGFPADGPFFTGEQVVWTMQLVEQLLGEDEADGMDEGGSGSSSDGQAAATGKRGRGALAPPPATSTGVSAKEWGLLAAIYGAERLAAVSHNATTFPVSTAQDGVLSVMASVSSMPASTLTKLGAKAVTGKSEGCLTTLALLEALDRSGKLPAALQAASEGQAGDGGLSHRLCTWFEPADTAAVLRSLLSRIEEEEGEEEEEQEAAGSEESASSFGAEAEARIFAMLQSSAGGEGDESAPPAKRSRA